MAKKSMIAREVKRAKTVAKFATKRAELKELIAEAQELKLQQQTQALHIAKHIGAAYRLTGQDFLKQLLNQESPDTLDRMMRYHRQFSASRLDLMAEYKETLAQLAKTNAALTVRQSRLDGRRADLQKEQSTLAAQRTERSRLVAALEAEQETKEEEHNRLIRDRERLETLLTQLRTRASKLDGSAFIAARGALLAAEGGGGSLPAGRGVVTSGGRSGALHRGILVRRRRPVV